MVKSTKQAKGTSGDQAGSGSFTQALATEPGFLLADSDPHSTPGFDGDKAAGSKLQAKTAQELADLQEKQYAEYKTVGRAAVLLVVAGMDN